MPAVTTQGLRPYGPLGYPGPSAKVCWTRADQAYNQDMTFYRIPGVTSQPTARPPSSQATGGLRQIEILEKKLDRLKLVTRALWEIVRDNTSITEELLEQKVREVDLRSGALDGRDTSGVKKCQNCGRTIQRGQDVCQYCGHAQGFESVFDWVC